MSLKKFEVGLLLEKNTNGIVSTARVLSVNPVKIQLRGADYSSITACAMADLQARGSNKKTVSGWDYYQVENPNPQSRGPRSPSVQSPGVESLLMSPEDLERKIREEMEARIATIRQAASTRLADLKAKETELAGRFESLSKQIAQCETDLSKVRGALASLSPAAQPVQPTAPVQAPPPAKDETKKKK